MTGYLWAALGLLGGLSMIALRGMISEEARDRLDHLPHAILRLAARRLSPSQRAAIYEDEWLPELTYILKYDEARPITRLITGTRYALGILINVSRITRHLHRTPAHPAPGSQSVFTHASMRGSFTYVVALLAAAAADIAVFYQALALTMADQSSAMVIVVAVGFAAVALFLAHTSGIMLRERSAGASLAPIFLTGAAVTTWFGLGALMFWVRLKITPGASSGLPQLSLSEQGAAAAVSAALYAGTGIITMIGAYLSHRPPRSAPR